MSTTHNYVPLIQVAVALVIVTLLAVHQTKWSGLDLREDEINTIHAARVFDTAGVVRWIATDIHPAGWRTLATMWVDVVGPTEPAVRQFSTLLTALSLALIFRLGTTLFDRQVGLLSMIALGLLPLFQFYSHEFRPYALLVAVMLAMQLVFLMWLRQQTFKYALLYVMLGALILQTHYFGFYVIIGQLVTLLVVVRWNRALYTRALGLFVAIGFSFTAWLLPFLHAMIVSRPGGPIYALETNASTLLLLGWMLRLTPAVLGYIFLLMGIVFSVKTVFPAFVDHPQHDVLRFRFGVAWRKWYVLLLPLVIFVLAFTLNIVVRNFVSRTVVIYAPAIAITIAYGIRSLPRWPLRVVVMGIFVVFGVSTFHRFELNGPYRGVLASVERSYQAHSPVLMETDIPGDFEALAYYLLDRMPDALDNDDMFHITSPELFGTFVNNQPEGFVHLATTASDADINRFINFVGEAEQVIHLRVADKLAFTDAYTEWLEQHYEVVRTETWDTERATGHSLTEYRRREPAS